MGGTTSPLRRRKRTVHAPPGPLSDAVVRGDWVGTRRPPRKVRRSVETRSRYGWCRPARQLTETRRARPRSISLRGAARGRWSRRLSYSVSGASSRTLPNTPAIALEPAQPSPNAYAQCPWPSPCTLPAASARRRGDRDGRSRTRAGAAHGNRMGGSSPPQLSRDIARRGGPLLLFLVAGRRRSSRVCSSVAAPCGARARRAGGDGRRPRDARSARESRGWLITAAAQPGHRAPRWSSPPPDGAGTPRRGADLFLPPVLNWH